MGATSTTHATDERGSAGSSGSGGGGGGGHPKHLPADERRAATVQAVVQLAAQHNPSDITTTAIAQHMGLTQGALFRHFASKEAILEAVMGWVADRLLTRMDEAAARAACPLDALHAMFMAHVDFVCTYPGVPRMIFGELQRPTQSMPKKMVQVLIQHYGQRLHQVLHAGKAAGTLDAQLDVQAATALFIGSIQGLVMQSLLAGDVARMRLEAPNVFAIYRRGIEGRAS